MNPKRTLTTLAISTASLLAAPALASATEFVSPTGTDSGDCSTVGTACEHIQQAVNNAAVGETVSVAAGTYDDEPGNQVLINKGLVLTGAGIGQTIIDGNSAHGIPNGGGAGGGTLSVLTNTTDAVTVSGLTVREPGTTHGAHDASGSDAHYAIFVKGTVPAGNATYTFNAIRVEGNNAGGRDNNFRAAGSNANLVVTNSQFTGADFNPILLERSQGTVDFNGNTVTKGAGAASTAVFDANYAGATPGNPSGTAGLHRFRNNTINANGLGSGVGIEAAWNIGGDSSGGFQGAEITGNTISNLSAAGAGAYMDNDSTGVAGASGLIGDANVNGNVITGPGGVGIRFRGFIAGIDVLNNQVTGGLTRGIQFDEAQGAPTHFPAQSEVHFNRIVGSTTAQLDHVAGSAPNAEDNWWGCNEGPNANVADCGTVTGTADFDPWIVMGLSAAPASIQTGGQSSQITADLTRNSDGDTVASIFPEGVAVGFNTNLGTITSPVPTQASRAISTLTSGATAGTANVTATLDNETQATNVAITAAPAGGVAGQIRGIEGACDNRMTGSRNADDLKGTGKGDRILGYAGDDVIAGRGHFDCLKGNKGDDRLFPGLASDIVQGGSGDDFVNARDGKRDKVNCGVGDDTVKVDQFDVVRNCESVTVRLRFRN